MALLTQADKKWIREKQTLQENKIIKLSIIEEIRQSTPLVYCKRLQFYANFRWQELTN